MPARPAFGPQWLNRQLARIVPDLPARKLCVALSGGVDSVTLLAALAEIPELRSRARAVHVEHGLHPDAPAWSAHCRRFAKRLGVPLRTLRAKVERTRGASLEASAREARYALLAGELDEGEVLLTAHHGDDQLETVLLQLMRGAGLPGLAAMPEMAPFARGLHVRPLLSRSRAELEEWAKSRGLTWVEDESNADERYDRNYLRRRVVPLLRERWPGVVTAVSRTARHAARAQQLLDVLARADVESAADGPNLSVKRLRALSAERRRNALRYWIGQQGRMVPDARRLEEIAGPVLDARSDANPQVAWDGVVLLRHADLLMLRDAQESPTPGELEWNWRDEPVLPLGSCGAIELQRDAQGPLDLRKLPPRLMVRWRKGGERLRPRAEGPRRTLKSLLQESRISVADRQRIPLLFAEDRLVAVADLWLDASVQATEADAQRARLRWRRD